MKTNPIPLPPQLNPQLTEPVSNRLTDFRYTETPVNTANMTQARPNPGDFAYINDRPHVFMQEEKIPGVVTEEWVPVKLNPYLSARRFPRRDRKTSWSIDDSGFRGEPRTIWEKSKRAFMAWLRYRSIEPAPFLDYAGARRRGTFAVRLLRVVKGQKPFQRPPHLKHFTARTVSRRNRVRVATDPRTSGIWKPVHFIGKPATTREAWKRANDAAGTLSFIHREGWRSLGFWFRYRDDETLPEETVQKANRRADWLTRNGARLRRVYCGLPPFRVVERVEFPRYYFLCRFILGESGEL